MVKWIVTIVTPRNTITCVEVDDETTPDMALRRVINSDKWNGEEILAVTVVRKHE